tara:strand:- start:389 stop:553 length:165 start_codon:yes stop_codon:yes gene_type:complete
MLIVDISPTEFARVILKNKELLYKNNPLRIQVLNNRFRGELQTTVNYMIKKMSS